MTSSSSGIPLACDRLQSILLLGVALWTAHSMLGVASPRLDRLPAQVAILFVLLYRENHVFGRRWRSALFLLARLGLRACEVCRLELGDIDWRGGTVRVRRKGGAEERLPLPHEVGEALAEHLQGELPRGASRCVFLTVRAPRRPLRGALHSVVTRAFARAGLARRPGGPHLLRHSLAAELLHRGASLPEVGQILGHRRTQTTEIYAKVRIDALRELALAWPERSGRA